MINNYSLSYKSQIHIFSNSYRIVRAQSVSTFSCNPFWRCSNSYGVTVDK